MSITEVARLAGVTHGTVSRLINDRGGVAEDTAHRIREAMRQLGYQPPPPGHRRGRKPSPAGIRTGNVCLLLAGISRGFVERPGVDVTVASIEGTLRRHALNMVLAYSTDLHDLPPAITKRKVDGLLVIGEANDSLPRSYQSLPAVWVLSSHAASGNWADHVHPDNRQVGVLAADYLAERGHRHVAFINAQPNHPGCEQRGQSFVSVAKSHGLNARMLVADADTEVGREDPWGTGSVSRQTRQLVDQLLHASPRPTGLFVPTDEQTFGIYPLLKEHGLHPGNDLDIVSCDNQDFWLRHITPRPASIDLNFSLIGEHAVAQLMLRIRHPEQPAGTRILVAPRLVQHGFTMKDGISSSDRKAGVARPASDA